MQRRAITLGTITVVWLLATAVPAISQVSNEPEYVIPMYELPSRPTGEAQELEEAQRQADMAYELELKRLENDERISALVDENARLVGEIEKLKGTDEELTDAYTLVVETQAENATLKKQAEDLREQLDAELSKGPFDLADTDNALLAVVSAVSGLLVGLVGAWSAAAFVRRVRRTATAATEGATA